MIVTQIKTAMQADPTIAGIVGTRIYQEEPISAPTAAYIEIRTAIIFRSMVDQEYSIQIFTFSDDLDTLETLNNAIISFFESKQTVGTDFYYKIFFVNQSSKTKLKNGFYFSVNNFIFKTTT